MSHLSQDNHGYPRLSQACLCVSPVPGQTWTSQVVPDMLMCPTCPRTTMDIPCCPRRAQDKHGHPMLSQACLCVSPVPGQKWTSQVVPGMLMCPTCPSTTMDIPGCPWHAPWTPPSPRSKLSHLSQGNSVFPSNNNSLFSLTLWFQFSVGGTNHGLTDQTVKTDNHWVK